MLPLRVWTRRQGQVASTAWIRLPLTLLLFGLVFVNFGNVFGREPGSVLGCGLLALKMLEAERVRDARVAMGFAAFVLMSALLFNQTMVFTVLVCGVLVLVLAALVALQPAPTDESRSFRSSVRLAALLFGFGLPLAAASFVLTPRLGSPLWGSPGGGMARTGLSDRMEPGALTELLADESPAFRVEFDAAPPPASQRYFRTIVLWDFDGASWTRPRGFYGGPAEEARATGATIDYSITLEATDQRWLPALDDFAPQLVYVSAGFDGHRDDDMGNLGLIEADYAWVTRQIMDVANRHCRGRVVSCLEGGYALDPLARSVAAHVRVLMGAD
jgi:hypothetical protein